MSIPFFGDNAGEIEEAIMLAVGVSALAASMVAVQFIRMANFFSGVDKVKREQQDN